MRISEIVGLIFFTLILVGLVIPVPCLPPECGPSDAGSLSTFQLIQVYLYQPLTWGILITWAIAIIVWINRWLKSKKNEK